MCIIALNSPQPSTLAASTYSDGIVSRNCRSRKIENASPNASGMISGHSVPERWSCCAQNEVHRHDHDLGRQHHGGDDHDPSRRCGRGTGTGPVRRRPGSSTRASARSRPPRRRWCCATRSAKPGVSQTSTKLCHCQVCGHRSRVSVCSSLITAVRPMNTNGSRNNRPSAMAERVQRDPLQSLRPACAGRRGGQPDGLTVSVGRPGRGCSDIRPHPAGRSCAHQQRGEHIESANSTSAITQAEPVSNRWKPRL